MKNTLLTIALGGLLTISSQAATLANPNFDTDSYIFMGTSAETDPQITLGESLQGTPSHPHFNFGVVSFDVSSLSTSGDKFLSLSSIEYGSTFGGGSLTPTGSATVQVVALGDSFANFQAAADKTTWYDTYVQSGTATVIGTFNFTDQSTEYVDVTDVVNGWISDGNSNYGFALFSTSGAVELASSTYSDDTSLQPALVDAVPEPSGAVLAGIGSLLLLLRRQRA